MQKVLAGVMLLALLVGAYLLGKREVVNSSIQKLSSHSAESKANHIPVASELAKVNVKTSPENNLPLPPANIPLGEIYSLLQNRADAGDGKAACRLAIELIRCKRALTMNKFMMEYADRSTFKVDGQGSSKSVDQVKAENSFDEQRLQTMEKAQACANISDHQFKQTFRYLRQGAHSSQPDAMASYADGMGFVDGNFSMLRGQDFEQWRQDARQITENALRQGVPEAVELLHNAYADDNSLFSGLIENDPLKATTMLLLRLRIEGKPFPSKTTLNASDYQRAISGSDTMFQEYFGREIKPKTNFTKSLMLGALFNNEEASPCDQGPE